MKWDFCIGNPPYQGETVGDNQKFAPPVYNYFIDAATDVADKVELIHPARFLFNAGSTPKAWNEKMLSDTHFKVLYSEQDSSKVFPNTDIKGGVAITYHDARKDFGAIGTFTAFPELNEIRRKAAPQSIDDSLASIIYLQNRFNLDALYKDYPEMQKVIGSEGKDKRFRSNSFDKVSLFTEAPTDATDIKVLGISSNKRVWRYFPVKYFDNDHENFHSWKVLVPCANGSGALGEVLSTPLIGTPLIGYTQSFIGIGAFSSEKEAQAAMKYVKSKFARCMLGILKITQANNSETWRLVPLPNFSAAYDIDWSVSVADIDKQLYKKYGLSQEEIDFIESHVKAME